MSVNDHQLPPERGIYCNRTLNLRSIKAVGYDMDYTLVHYRVDEWERQAYGYIKRKLLALGWPVEQLEFDPDLVIRGLTLDIENGNILKANRFGYVKQASHGTQPMDFSTQRAEYSRTFVDLAEERYEFLNTLFSLSEACMYAQLVDMLDDNQLPGVIGYSDLYRLVRASTDETHVEGELKADITTDPDRYVALNRETPLALLDQHHAGKKLLLITNSEWGYTRSIMQYAFDEFLPEGMTWRDLFDVIIVSARKPAFFSTNSPVFRVVTEEGLLEPCPKGIDSDGTFLGGNARFVEAYLGLSGDEILYVGDHVFTDVHVSKDILRWRTALILRELETDLLGLAEFKNDQNQLSKLMAKKEELEFRLASLRLDAMRKKVGYGPQPVTSVKELDNQVGKVRGNLAKLDQQIAPLATAAGAIGNARWGPLMRAGNDKSQLARQVERYADIYMSRVSNFLSHTPFTYLRSRRGSLPHDPGDMPLVADSAGPEE
ncbi:MAG: HAD-IG family 5'-nucleotidase [Gemmatimonadota bacterium]|nr:MAG: HAD-IG family 5'-nucleotidase [Gemmatimonadota bacterium]